MTLSRHERIPARGAKPAELPMEHATKFELVVNLTTARDDILDANRSLLTATLIAEGAATRLGPPKPRGRYGLPMNIWY